MRVAAPFFTTDKNICWDINLELQSSLPLLPHHPSSFRTNHHLGTPPSLSPQASYHPHITRTLKPCIGRPHKEQHVNTFCSLVQLQACMHRHTFGEMQRLSPTGHKGVTHRCCVQIENSNQGWNAKSCMAGVKKAGPSSCHSGRLLQSSPITASRGDPALRLPPYWHLCLHPITHLPAIIHHPSRSIGGHAFISPWVLMGKRRVGGGDHMLLRGSRKRGECLKNWVKREVWRRRNHVGENQRITATMRSKATEVQRSSSKMTERLSLVYRFCCHLWKSKYFSL